MNLSIGKTCTLVHARESVVIIRDDRADKEIELTEHEVFLLFTKALPYFHPQMISYALTGKAGGCDEVPPLPAS